MIAFRHHTTATRITLQAGEFWAAAPSSAETYRDTPARELQQIVDEVTAGEPWRTCVQRHYAQSNPWLSRIVTDPCRDLFFRQHPPKPGSVVLDVGAGWGQLSLPLARECTVVALEPTPERLAFIEASARQEGVVDRMCFVQSDLFDVGFESTFDVVSCVGVLEWVPKFRAGDPREAQIEFLRRLNDLLAPGGKLVIGIENRLGLKYLLGAPDDHLGISDIGVYDARLAARKWRAASGNELRCFTHTRVELAELLAAAGLVGAEFFAALPDYKLPQAILPLGTEIDDFFLHGDGVAEHDGVHGRPLPNQDELRSHYQSLARLGIAEHFVPSFYVCCRRHGGVA